MVDDFIERKHGRKKVEYLHPALEDVLADTYGVIVYQEQVMQIARTIAGYSLGNADLLRRAMGKKKKEVMDQEKIKFIAGALENKEHKVSKKVAEDLFDLMAFFAGYGFNRSHSAAYGWITYQTAYLKHHYPNEFMAGLMSCDQHNTDNIVKFINEAKSMGLSVARPDINLSAKDFRVVVEGEDKVIRFGLGAVKGVGSGAVEMILNVRNEEPEPFNSIFEFCEKVDSQKVNRRVIEALVKAGAFEDVPKGVEGFHRARTFGSIEKAIERGAQSQKDRRNGQTSLFGLLEPVADKKADPGRDYPEAEEWTSKELLSFEKESLGFYISGHPLDRYRSDLARYSSASTTDFDEGKRGPGECSVGGVVSSYRERPTRRGNGKLAFFQLEDSYGQLEVIVFPKSFEKLRDTLVSDEPLLCRGKVVDEGEGENHAWKMLLSEATPLAELRSTKTSRVEIKLDPNLVTQEQIAAMHKILRRSKGRCKSLVRMAIPNRSETVVVLDDQYNVSPSDQLLTDLEKVFGDRVASFM